MASDVYPLLDKADLAEPEAGEPVLTERQIRLLGRAELEIAGSAYPVIRKPLSAAELRRHLVAALERGVRALTPAATA